ncbi:ABC transporter family protein [Cryptosporidium andersoni]|uniref:ABC transporter family protein n=1 Tax=Cryptosporidium andersoni TaxID=117008 RepID=A0A1J4MDI4_9CRYT|nr:ABC transporter family protein [Cryptosporidium andersoni]
MSSGKIYKEIENYSSLLSNSSKYERGSSRGITPELTASWWSKLTFSWFSSFMDDAYEVEPDLDKLFDLPEFDTPTYKLPLFEKYWSYELKKHGFKSDSSENNFTENTHNKTNDLKLTDPLVRKSRISIILVLFKCFKIHFIITLFLVILSSFANLSQPIFLRKLLLYTKEDNLILYKPENSFTGSLWSYISGNKHINSNLVFQGFILIVLITVLNIIHFLLKKQETLVVSNVGRYIRDLFTGLIYRKVLKMNSSIVRDNSNKQYQKRKLSVASVLSSNTANEIYGISGNLVNLLSNDISRFSRLYSAHEFYSSIISLTIAICLLYIYIGISGLAGVLVMIIHVILCVIALNYRAIERKPFSKVRDERILHISEYLSNVKIIKCYCWEDIFINKIYKIRQKEIKSLFIQGFYSALSFLCGGVVLHATLATIVVCSYMGQNIDQANIFFAYSMYDIICEILLLFPKSYAAFVDILLSCKRVNEFLLMEENKCNRFKEAQKQRNYLNKKFGMILFENVDLYWSNGTLLLRNVSFEAVSGEITAVIGCIGSGKSGLLGAIAGEITPKGGKFECIGSVAYVTQVPWIFTGTIRENIILGSSYNVDWYNTVINACALKEDFSILPHSDHTMIGEEGLNLSGGQKQRISLARAVYQKASIYVLDDCLSALDPNVAAHIIQECICGILKEACIIFATHNLDIVSYAHRLLILDHHNKCPIFIREPKDLTSINDYESFIGSINTQVCSIYKKQISNSQKVSELRELKVSDRTTEEYISTYNNEFYEEEELKKGRISFDTYKSYIVAFGKINLLILIGLNFVGALIQVYGVFFIGHWSEFYSTVDYGHALKVCIFISILFPLILILSWILIYYGGILVSSIYHNKLLRYIKITPFTFFEKTPIGRILNRFTSDLFLVDESLPQMFGNLVLAIIQFSVWSILTLYITPQLIFCIPIITYLCYKVTKKYPPVIRQGERLSGVLLAPISSQVTETMNGLSTIRAFNSEDLFIKRMDKAITALSRVRYHMDIASCWLYLRLEIIGCIGLFCGGMFGVILVSFNSEYTQFLGFLLSFVMTTSGWIRFIIFVLICLEADMIGLERIKSYVDNYISENNANLSLFKANKQCLSKGKVEFINLELKYDGVFPILKNVNFYIESGEKIGIVGRTGSGKSSMFTVLLRLVEPSKGIIKVDDIDISSIHTNELRRKIFIIPQDPVIFSGTIRFNIDPVSEYTDKEVLEALYRSNLHHTINSLPDGINYILDSGGSNLSVGQKQLICLARAVLRKPKILLLDEATSSIDTYTESLIQETINREFQEATVLTIAHRIQTIIHSDKVMVIDCGQIAEFDSPQNLINKSSGLFSSLVNASS